MDRMKTIKMHNTAKIAVRVSVANDWKERKKEKKRKKEKDEMIRTNAETTCPLHLFYVHSGTLSGSSSSSCAWPGWIPSVALAAVLSSSSRRWPASYVTDTLGVVASGNT